MTLVQLVYLVALDTHRHFRKAALYCRVAQPSLSTQIRKLEEELGVILFDRDKKPLAPTAVGEKVIAQARIVLAEVENLRDLVQPATGKTVGELRIGIVPTLAPYLLPLVVPPFARRHPRISLLFEEMRGEQILAQIRRDVLDAGLMATPVVARGLIEQPLFDEPFVGYVAPGHRLASRETLSPSDVRFDDVWLPGKETCLHDDIVRIVAEAQQADSRARRAIRVQGDNLETLKRLVEQGDGMAMLPALAVRGPAAFQEALVRPFAAPAPVRTIRVVFARALLKRPLLDVLTAEIAAAVKAVLPEAGP